MLVKMEYISKQVCDFNVLTNNPFQTATFYKFTWLLRNKLPL